MGLWRGEGWWWGPVNGESCDMLDVLYLTSRGRDSGVVFDIPRSAAIDRPAGFYLVLVLFTCRNVDGWYLQLFHVLYCKGTTGQEGGYRTQRKPRCASQGNRMGKIWQDKTSSVLHLAFLGFLQQKQLPLVLQDRTKPGQLFVSSSRQYCLSPETRTRHRSVSLLQ